MFSLAILTVLALGWLCGCLRDRRRTEAPAPRPPSPPLVRSSDSSVEDETAQPEVSDEIACPALSAAPPVDPASVALPDSPPPSPEPEEPDFTLPADIVLLVLDLVAAFELEEQANRTLAACCLVSRRMCRLAQPYLHRELRIELEPTGRCTAACSSSIFTTQPASIERVRLVCTLISRLSAITIVGSMEFPWVPDAEFLHAWSTLKARLVRPLKLSIPVFPFPLPQWPTTSTAFIEGFASLIVGIELVYLYHVDYPTILSLPNLVSLSIHIPYSAFEPAPRLPIPPPLLPLLSLTVTDCGQPHIVWSLICLFPSIRTLALGFPHYPPFSHILNGLSLELLPHLCELTLLCHSPLRAWQAGLFAHSLNAVLSSSLPHPPLLAHPSAYSTFRITVFLPGDDPDLAVALDTLESSGLPQRIKTDPRLARVEEVRFEMGKAARS